MFPCMVLGREIWNGIFRCKGIQPQCPLKSFFLSKWHIQLTWVRKEARLQAADLGGGTCKFYSAWVSCTGGMGFIATTLYMQEADCHDQWGKGHTILSSSSSYQSEARFCSFEILHHVHQRCSVKASLLHLKSWAQSWSPAIIGALYYLVVSEPDPPPSVTSCVRMTS